MLFYRAALPLSRRTLDFAAGIIRRHRKSIGSRWRKLNCGQQALLVLAYLREMFAELAARVEGRHHDRVAVRGKGRGLAGAPRPGAPPVGPRRENKPGSQKEANKAHAKLQSPGERANARLKTWHILDKLRCCPRRAGQLACQGHSRIANPSSITRMETVR